ncbi:efflux transporter outer membrane subunit [Zhongshania aquimaris]|uniref:Efflux transporter outer membrane subunit n=1 Tax=Zhongshania aquimaris TaxID=2857107 RepID=A0ABS6VWF5_9GAMM|nr:efflux transporter outer membrane subunit [Zhongshania aquimaris]MBW2942665.1 efflux transporter outer membrane subunit [Zhongshania aquimaris]
MTHHRFIRRIAMLLGLMSGLSGCANYIGINSSSHLLRPDNLAAETSLTVDDKADAEWPTQAWWQSFNDTQLDSLINEALQNNPNLTMAAAKVARANAALAHFRAATLPSASLSVDATRQHYSENAMYPPPLGGSTQTSGNIRLQASYELDFWGRNRAAVAASQSRLAAAQAESASARLMLASAVSKTYFQLAQLQQFLRIGESALKQRQEIYDLTKQRVDAGLDTQVELMQAETQLPLTRTNIEMVKENIINTQHALAALLGSGPDRALSLQAPLPTLDSGVTQAPQDLRISLLGHRPDLVAARWQVEASEHDTTANKAAFYPNINLMAFAGYASLGLDQLVRSSSENYGVGPALSLPIFDGGRLRANLKASFADYDAAVANYNQTLLEALRDVADHLNSYRFLQTQIEQQQFALKASRRAYDLALQRYHAGLGNYLTVLNAQSVVIQQQLFQSQLQMRAANTHVELSRALGGGYPYVDARAQNSAAERRQPSNKSTINTINTVSKNTSVQTAHVGAQYD